MSVRASAVTSTLKNTNCARFKALPKKNSPRALSLDFRRRFTPRTNKSFICYKEAPTGIFYSKNRSFSIVKTKGLVLRETSPKNKQSATSRARDLKSTNKAVSGHSEAKETHQREVTLMWMEQGNSYMKQQNYSKSLEYFKKVLHEEKHPEALYKKSLCLMYLKQHKQAIPHLTTLIKDAPLFNREAYTALALCFVASSDYVTAVRQLSRGLLRFPRFSQGYTLRGQLYNSQHKWSKAIADFYRAMALSSSEGDSYLGLSDSLLGMGDTKHALEVLGQAINCQNTMVQGLVKRGKCYYELKQYSLALADLDQALSVNSGDPETYYFKAMTLLEQEDFADATLSFEQAIKYDTVDRKFTGPAVYNLGAIRVKQCDFYGAMYTFKRAIDCNSEIPEQKALKAYVDAVLSLMKRHFQEGLGQLARIIKKKHPLTQEYLPKCHAFRGYAHASLAKHDLAVKDFIVATKLKGLDSASEYNYLISRAIVLSEQNLSKSLEVFSLAAQLFPKNIEPFIYKAAVLLELSITHNNSKHAKTAKKLLNEVIAQRKEDSDAHFFRAVTLYYLEDPSEAIRDLELAIDKAEDNIPAHFLVRGLCYAQLELYKEAVHDFSIVLQLDEGMSIAYLYRGRCAFLLQDTDSAFLDYQKLILGNSSEPGVHIHAGDLLLLIGSTEDSISAYANANSIKESAEAYIKQARGYILLEDFPSAIDALSKASVLEGKPELLFDKLVLEAAHSLYGQEHLSIDLYKAKRAAKTGVLCGAQHLHLYLGLACYLSHDFTAAATEFTSALNTADSPLQADLLYNLAVSHIILAQYSCASARLKELLHYAQNQDKGKVYLLLGLLALGLKNKTEAKGLMTKALEHDPRTVESYLREDSQVSILPFSSGSALAGGFPFKAIAISECRPILLRPSCPALSLPCPSLHFSTEASIFLHFTVKAVKCKPEAPWLNRVKGAIQFTDEICEMISEAASHSEASVTEPPLERLCKSTAGLLNRACEEYSN